MNPDIDRELMRKKDRLNIMLAWCGIITGIFTIVAVLAGIFVAIYVRPVEAKLNNHILKNEPETANLLLRVNTLEIQYIVIIKKLDRIELAMNEKRHAR